MYNNFCLKIKDYSIYKDKKYTIYDNTIYLNIWIPIINSSDKCNLKLP